MTAKPDNPLRHPPQPTRAGPLAGLLIMGMILSVTVDNLLRLPDTDWLRWIASGSAWTAAMLLIHRATRVLRVQVGLLLGAGLVMMVLAHSEGVSMDPLAALSINTGLLSMIAAVGFLRLVAPAAGRHPDAAAGRQAGVLADTGRHRGVRFGDQYFGPYPDR